MGLHTGEALLEDGRYHGLSVHRAARISGVAHGGQVLLSESTRSLLADEEQLSGVGFRDLGALALKDFDRPIRVYRLTAPGLADVPHAAACEDSTPRRAVVAAVVVVAIAAVIAVALVIHSGRGPRSGPRPPRQRRRGRPGQRARAGRGPGRPAPQRDRARLERSLGRQRRLGHRHTDRRLDARAVHDRRLPVSAVRPRDRAPVVSGRRRRLQASRAWTSPPRPRRPPSRCKRRAVSPTRPRQSPTASARSGSAVASDGLSSCASTRRPARRRERSRRLSRKALDRSRAGWRLGQRSARRTASSRSIPRRCGSCDVSASAVPTGDRRRRRARSG